jgi:hypothetical protein
VYRGLSGVKPGMSLLQPRKGLARLAGLFRRPATESTQSMSVVDVTAYTPPRDGVVQGVVTVQKNTDGTEQEIGRFGIFPNTEFSAADRVQRYSFPLPRDVLQDGPVKLAVHVVPLRGEGEGARIEVGGAEIK